MREAWAKRALVVGNKKRIRSGAIIAHGACAPGELNAKHNSSARHGKRIGGGGVGVVLTSGFLLEKLKNCPAPAVSKLVVLRRPARAAKSTRREPRKSVSQKGLHA